MNKHDYKTFRNEQLDITVIVDHFGSSKKLQLVDYYYGNAVASDTKFYTDRYEKRIKDQQKKDIMWSLQIVMNRLIDKDDNIDPIEDVRSIMYSLSKCTTIGKEMYKQIAEYGVCPLCGAIENFEYRESADNEILCSCKDCDDAVFTISGDEYLSAVYEWYMISDV